MTGKQILEKIKTSFPIPLRKDIDLALIKEQEIIVSLTPTTGFAVAFRHEGHPIIIQITGAVGALFHYSVTTIDGCYQGPILTTSFMRSTFFDILAELHDPQ